MAVSAPRLGIDAGGVDISGVSMAIFSCGISSSSTGSGPSGCGVGGEPIISSPAISASPPPTRPFPLFSAFFLAPSLAFFTKSSNMSSCSFFHPSSLHPGSFVGLLSPPPGALPPGRKSFPTVFSHNANSCTNTRCGLGLSESRFALYKLTHSLCLAIICAFVPETVRLDSCSLSRRVFSFISV